MRLLTRHIQIKNESFFPEFYLVVTSFGLVGNTWKGKHEWADTFDAF